MKFTKLLLILFLLASCHTGYAQQFFWGNQSGGVESYDLATSSSNAVAPGSSTFSVVTDCTAGLVYYNSPTGIGRANADGTGVDDAFIPLSQSPYGMALDATNGKIYFSQFNANRVGVVNVDGTGLNESLVAGIGSPSGLTVDEANGVVYGITYNSTFIFRFNTDGTGYSALTGNLGGQGLAIDYDGTNNKLVYSIRNSSVFRMNTDGSLQETIVTGQGAVQGLEIFENKIYWFDVVVGTIRSADLDGSNVADVHSGISAWHLTVCPSPSVDSGPTDELSDIYWAAVSGSVERYNEEASATTTVSAHGGSGFAVAADCSNGLVYYNTSTGIGRANADGTGVNDAFIPLSESPYGMALDATNGKIYFSQFNANRVGVVNVDGTGLNESLVSGIGSPSGLTVDEASGVVYGITYNSTFIFRFNTNGTGYSALTGGLGGQGVAIDYDATNDKLVYSTRNASVFRMNTDGSAQETIVTGQSAVQGLSISPKEQKIYWLDIVASTIRSSDLDGSNVADVLNTGGSNIWHIDVCSKPILLAVLLESFTGNRLKGDVQLNWRTGTEENHSHFVVERSRDGVVFSPIGEVLGEGSNLWSQSYEFTDDAPLLGNNYYRLAMVDLDGNISYSEIVVVLIQRSQHLEVSLYPNPTVAGQTAIEYMAEENELINISVVDMSGRQVYSHQQESGLERLRIPLDLDHLTNGLYFVRLSTPSMTNSFKLMVK